MHKPSTFFTPRKTKLIYRVIIFLSLTASAATGNEYEQINDGYILFAAAVWIAGWVWIAVTGNKLWLFLSRLSPVHTSIPLSKLAYGSSVIHRAKGYRLIGSDSEISYFIANPKYSIASTNKSSVMSNDSDTFTLSYLVAAVHLHKQVPHIFIDGLSQNLYKPSHPNLWSLAKLMNKADKLQDLEGDFPKYFSVYAADKNSMALTILAPDVMLELRDKGYLLDYELYGEYLYIYSEPRFDTEQAIEKYVAAVRKIAAEVAKQVQTQNFALSEKELSFRQKTLRYWGGLYSLYISLKIGGMMFLCIAYATILASILQGGEL